MRGRTMVVVGLAATGTVVGAGTASAAPKEGCPAASGGWELETVADTAAMIWDGLEDTSPWPGGLEEFTVVIGGYDRNGNGDLCLKIIVAENPNARWHEFDFFVPVDDNAAATRT
jgi:hypothetical protein